jgi:hypothetical protein
VGVGCDPSYPLEVQSGGVGTVLRAGTDFVSIDSTGTEAEPTLILNGDANTGLWHPAADTLAVSTGGAERMRISSTGQTTLTSSNQNVLFVNRQTSNGDVIVCEYGGVDRLRLGTEGITFPNGGNAPASAAENLLDYYKEGTWGPTLPNGGSLTTNSATYTRIGNICHLQFFVTSIAPTANTSRFEIGGLPFYVSDLANYFAAGSIGFAGDGQFANYRIVGNNNATTCYFHTVAGSTSTLSNNDFISQFSGVSDALVCSITYRVK